jgi:SAM-dependent methyltransferase
MYDPRRTTGVRQTGSVEPRDPGEDVRRISEPAISEGDATGWFDQLYAEAAIGRAVVPWDRGGPHPLLVEWVERRDRGSDRRTLVVGSGFGEDTAYLARQGFGVIGFDISAAAVRAARRRFPSVPVDFRVADLLNPPAEWHQHFDLVVESNTVQALPERLRQTAATHVARFVRTGGTLLVLAAARDATEDDVGGPPWPLTRSDIDSFATEGLVAIEIEELREPPDVHRWRAEFRRPH